MWQKVRRAMARITVLEQRVERQHQRISELHRELNVRVAPQLSALEQRVEELRQRLDRPDLSLSEHERAQARSLLEEVRDEHARIRARITAATVFEERLRVLESGREARGH